MLWPASGLVPPGGQVRYCYKIPGRIRAAALGVLTGKGLFPFTLATAVLGTLLSSFSVSQRRRELAQDLTQLQVLSPSIPSPVQHPRVRCPSSGKAGPGRPAVCLGAKGSPGCLYLLARAAESPLYC